MKKKRQVVQTSRRRRVEASFGRLATACTRQRLRPNCAVLPILSLNFQLQYSFRDSYLRGHLRSGCTVDQYMK